ncbi:MAG TPA: zinc ribbon domain-containing protein [Candidatus Eisenbacteria bacterium]|uniref:Zinc ribbon domain-containing protein n=1 Tax=Eiseniibacteriota bacterium TaxID=2212470 RepID=A0A7V2F3J2_UNCEI|nr:zinc ribbon domain-containing protein [Candidatus Eisenbacteria bacterium]
MYCRFCGREIEEGSGACIYCGRALMPEPPPSRMYSRDFTKLKAPAEGKNPKVASLLGFLLGWILLGPVGYIYLGQWNWFWIAIVIQIFAYPLTAFIGAYILLPFVYAFHQYEMAKEVNKLVKAVEAGNDGGRKAGQE